MSIDVDSLISRAENNAGRNTTPVGCDALIQQYRAENELAISQFTQALTSAGLSPSSLASTLGQLNDNCDAACQSRRQLELSYGEFASTDCQSVKDKARSNLLRTLKQNGNSDDYNRLIGPTIQRELDALLQEFTDDLNSSVATNNSNINAYGSMYNSYEHIKQLSDATMEEHKQLKRELDEKLKFTQTGERKLWYKFQSIESQHYYFLILMVIYYGLLLFFSIKKINENFENVYFLSKLIILLLVPLVLNYVSIIVNYSMSIVKSVPNLF